MKKFWGILMIVLGGLFSLSLLSGVSKLRGMKTDTPYDMGHFTGYLTAQLLVTVIAFLLLFFGIRFVKADRKKE